MFQKFFEFLPLKMEGYDPIPRTDFCFKLDSKANTYTPENQHVPQKRTISIYLPTIIFSGDMLVFRGVGLKSFKEMSCLSSQFARMLCAPVFSLPCV